MAKTTDEVRATRETVQEATDLYNRGGIQITRYSAGKGKLGVQVSTGYQKYIQLTEPQMKTLAQILPKLQRDLRKDLMKKEDVNESEVDELNELKKSTYKSYIKKSEKDDKKAWKTGDYNRSVKRGVGQQMASDALKREELKGDQHKLDHNKDGKITGDDFKGLRNKKSKKENDVVKMNPKVNDAKNGKEEQKESVMTIRDKLIAVLEGDRSKHYKGAAEAEKMDDKYKGAGAKLMKKDHEGPTIDLEKQSHDDASKAGRVTKQSKMRSNDKKDGDKNIINQPADVTKKGKGTGEVKSEAVVQNVVAAYRSMYEKKNESVVKSADRKPETYTKPDGKKAVRMVPVDKQVVKTEEKDIEEKLTQQQKVARDAGRGKDKAATDYVKARMKAAAGKTSPNEPTGKDLDRRIHKGAPGDDSHFGGGGRGSHDTSARPKDKLASQPDIRKRLANKKARGDFDKARRQSQSPSGRSGMGGVGIRT